MRTAYITTLFILGDYMAKTVTVSLKGDKEFKKILKKLGDNAPKAIGKVLYGEAEEIMGDSKANYVPVAPDGGTLRASGHVQLPKIKGSKVTVTMGYGGAASAYALAVHEHLSEHSPRSWKIAESKGTGVHFNVGGPKYLETPTLEAAKDMPRRLSNGLKLFFYSKGKI